MRDIVGSDHAAKLQRLAAGEAQLEQVAERAEKRQRWQRHAGNVARTATIGSTTSVVGAHAR